MKLILLYNTPYNYATEFDGAFKRLLIVIQNSFGHFNAEEEEGFFYSFLRHTSAFSKFIYIQISNPDELRVVGEKINVMLNRMQLSQTICYKNWFYS